MGQDSRGGSQDPANYIPIVLKTYQKIWRPVKWAIFLTWKALGKDPREETLPQKANLECSSLCSRAGFLHTSLFRSQT
jgi:hypothetical protein